MSLSGRHLARVVAVVAALGFMAFFIWIVVIADKADGTPWWSFIDRIPCGDKVGHLGLIGTMSFLCNLAFPSARPRLFPVGLTVTSLVLLALLTGEELSQGFIPSRHLDVFDWLADLTGLAVGQFLANWLRGKFRKPASLPSAWITTAPETRVSSASAPCGSRPPRGSG